MPAQIFATPTGWWMKSSPLRRRWSAWCSQAKTNAGLDALAVDLDGGRVGVLLDDREDVGQQAALERREVGAVDLRVALGRQLVDGRAASARALTRGCPYAAFAVWSVSHRRPSSSRCW